jgi:hypothetical protein
MPSLCPCHPCVHAIPVSMPSLCPCHPCVHAIPVSMPSLCPCHSVCHVAIQSCVRASCLCACHLEHTRMERVHARMADRRHQEEEAEKKGEGRYVPSTSARCLQLGTSTGPSTRGMRLRHCPLGYAIGGMSPRNRMRAGLLITSTSVEAPMSPLFLSPNPPTYV